MAGIAEDLRKRIDADLAARLDVARYNGVTEEIPVQAIPSATVEIKIAEEVPAITEASIIAYKQPITRAEIEAIRGVPPDNMIRILQERQLVKEVGRKDAPGRPCQFGTTKEFLKFFNLNSIAELPALDEKESERFELAR